MQSFQFKGSIKHLALTALGFGILALPSLAQSSLQDHPTPVVRNEIEATIKARDLGDARLTTHYYWFDGAQGDVFINWTSKNFAGDVDLFIQNGLRPLSKIVVYADFGEVETGRVIYLRKPERLLLRVQGRTPNDDAASYRLKFAGSFVAATANEKDDSALPSVGETVAGAVRVNSVGTILPPPPKPVATVKDEIPSSVSIGSDKSSAKSDTEIVVSEKPADRAEKNEETKLEVVVEENLKKSDAPKTAVTNRSSRRTRPPRKSVRPTPDPGAEKEKKEAVAISEPEAGVKAETEARPPSADEKATVAGGEAVVTPKTTLNVDPLANVQLVILFKDGSKIERPLPDVFRFTVDRGVLTVVSKDGRVGKYQMLNVAKVTIE
jgi:hypothetical protein